MERQRGFTLVELMITLVVLAIVIGLAAPSMLDLIRSNRIETASNELVSAFNYARVEAVKRGQRVSACPSTNGTSCSGTAWQNGWIVFVDGAATDMAANPTVVTVLSRRGALATGVTAVGGGFVRYSGLGFAPVRSNVEVSSTGCTGNRKRVIAFTPAGRIGVTRASC